MNDWLKRWDAAYTKMLTRFYKMPPCEKSLKWAERNSARLCRLAERKRPSLKEQGKWFLKGFGSIFGG